MLTHESSQAQQTASRSRWPRGMIVLAVVVLAVGVALVAWLVTNDEGPVAADEAQIEMTYSGDEVSYVGDHQIIEGTVTITFTNESEREAMFIMFGYDTGSEALAEELAFVSEGNRAVPTGPDPVAGFYDVDFDYSGDLSEPGSHTWTMDLAPGTYIFDVGSADFMTTGLWRLAVIEVVSG